MANVGSLAALGAAVGAGLNSIGRYSSNAASKANSISAGAQSAAANFNQESANNANNINAGTLASQYDYNSARMAEANAYNTEMWEKTAAWNESMWQKQADFNAEQAQLNRDFQAAEALKLRQWQENLSNTQYQRAIKDMEAAGLNPILAVTSGINTNVPSGAAGSGAQATVGGAQMSSAQSAMTSGGLLGANDASISGYQGQMENMSSTLALIGAVMGGLSSAMKSLGSLGDFGEGLGNSLGQLLTGKNYDGTTYDEYNGDKGNKSIISEMKESYYNWQRRMKSRDRINNQNKYN